MFTIDIRDALGEFGFLFSTSTTCPKNLVPKGAGFHEGSQLGASWSLLFFVPRPLVRQGRSTILTVVIDSNDQETVVLLLHNGSRENIFGTQMIYYGVSCFFPNFYNKWTSVDARFSTVQS